MQQLQQASSVLVGRYAALSMPSVQTTRIYVGNQVMHTPSA